MKRVVFPVLAAGFLLLTACTGSGDAADADAAPASGDEPVTLNHPTEQGLEISFEQQPQTLVMDCYAYSSLHEYGLEPVALFGYDCENPFVMGDIDISGIELVGLDGEIDMEQVAELQPDAIVGHGSGAGWSWFDDDVNAQLTQVAPFVPVSYSETVDDAIAATREIAEFFGGDVTADHVVAAEEDLASAKAAFTEAIAANDVTFMLTSPTKEMLYTAVGFAASDLLEDLGATVVGAPAPESGNPWGQVAWEQASTYPADVILVEGYSEDYAFSAELWDSLPAVQAGQLEAWGSKGAMTARAYADWLNVLAAQVDSAEDVA
ncbi:MAG: ABC transporter substrate-binding protein [Beutenbergiaceae bacterium]